MTYFQDKHIEVYLGDCVEVMKQFSCHCVTAIVTDFPYGIGFMNRGWDKPTGKEWGYFPGSGNRLTSEESLNYQYAVMEWTTEMLRVLKPGGFLLGFGGTRTFHRLTCGIEDAGFEIRDCIMWMYGSGFPKSHNISKAIDKELGKEREVIGKRKHPTLKDVSKIEEQVSAAHGDNKWAREWDLTAPASPEAVIWEGYGTALKPAYEPILVAMKPLDGTFADNAMNCGVAGLNIDNCRIETIDNLNGVCYSKNKKEDGQWGTMHNYAGKSFTQPKGRWPANIILDEEAGHLLDRQSGHLKSGKLLTHHHRSGSGLVGSSTFKIRERTGEECNFGGDDGGASRFFYCAKASRKERGESNNHPTVKPLSLMKYLVKLVAMPQETVILDPFLGSGTTAIACKELGVKCIGIEKEQEYFDIAKERIENATPYALFE